MTDSSESSSTPNADLEVLYHEGPCLVVNKPAGVLTQAPPGIDSMAIRVADYFRRTEQKTGNVYVGVPHRLDRPVSGALVFARHVRATRRLADQFAGRIVGKSYQAIVTGRVDEDEGEWQDYLYKVPGEARAVVRAGSMPDAKLARLRFRVLHRAPHASWLEIELVTGRTHQIRVQAAHRGYPIWGDELYGSNITFGEPSQDPRQRPIALHARRLNFRHPMTHEPVTVEAPFPATWNAWPTFPAGSP